MSLPAGAARYLLELHDALDLSPVERVRAVAEVEEHLIDAVEHGAAMGLDADTAAQRAVAQFGTVEEVAGAFRTEAGIHAAPYTFLHRLDVWRADHIWLGGVVAALPLVIAPLAIVPLFALLGPGSLRWSILGGILRAPFIPMVLLAHCAGQALVGHLLRTRPEPTFSGRLRGARAEQPMRVALLLMVPYALGWELGVLATRNMHATVGSLLMPWLFVAIPVVGTLREKRPSVKLPRWSRPLALVAFFVIPLLLTSGLRGRTIGAAVVAAAVYGGAFVLLRRAMRGRRVGPWIGAVAFLAPMALSMMTFSVGSSRDVTFATVLFPIGLTVLMTPMLALNLSRVGAEEQRKRLATEAEQWA